jgi:hypothetical protein
MVALGTLAGPTVEAWAAGGGEACTLTTKTDIQKADKIKGTAVVIVRNFDQTAGTSPRADATLTLNYNGVTAVFRATVTSPDLTSPEAALCGVINANPKTQSNDTIFTAFGLSGPADGSTQVPSDFLKLCFAVEPKSAQCTSIDHLDFNPIPGTQDPVTGNFDWSASVKITLYHLNP